LCHKTKPSHHNNRELECPCETTSIEGFVQLVACNLLPHGYWFYVAGRVPDGKDPRAVDAKLVGKYAANVSPPARAARKRRGLANLRYVRHGRFFVLLATRGEHPFFEQEAASIRDIRRVPLKVAGYWISYRRGQRTRDGRPDPAWHAHVQIAPRRFRELRAYFAEMATRWSANRLCLEFYRLPFEPYAPIRRQLLRLLREVNNRRKRAGLELLPFEVLPMRRRVVKPFGPPPGHAAVQAARNGRSVQRRPEGRDRPGPARRLGTNQAESR
jgi:hypothetical protein